MKTAITSLGVVLVMVAGQAAWGQPVVMDYQKISDTEGGFAGSLDDYDHLGKSVASLGDLDGDGVGDIVVGTWGDGDGGYRKGSLWILFLNADGTVREEQKISSLEGGFTGALAEEDRFGTSVAGLGDLDGDGVIDIAVGAMKDDDGGAETGAVWVLFLNSDGTVKSHQKISDTEGGLGGALQGGSLFGADVAGLGDHDGDGVVDILVGAKEDDDGGPTRGAVWILFLNSDGTVKGYQKISDTQGGFTGGLVNYDYFGNAVTGLGDLDGDGIGDVGVAAFGDGPVKEGAVWILFLNSDGTVKGHQKINDVEGGFTGYLSSDAYFGIAVGCLGDVDGDGVVDIAVTGTGNAGVGSGRGMVWLLYLNSDGTVKGHEKISDTEGGFGGDLDDDDIFGSAVALLGDLDDDGLIDVAVGARGDDDGGMDRGAVWILGTRFETPGPGPGPVVTDYQKISDTEGGFAGVLDDVDHFGRSAAPLGDLDGDGVTDIAMGAVHDDDGGDDSGAVWILFLNSDGTVKGHQKISNLQGGFAGGLSADDQFGIGVNSLGDLDGDGVVDIAVGARFDDDGGTNTGAVWILFLNTDGTVKSHQKISANAGGMVGAIPAGATFGDSMAELGDVDRDGVADIAVGARYDDDGGTNRGAVWILFLNRDGTVKNHQKISDTQGGFTGQLRDQDRFGVSVTELGDLDGDGMGDMAVGAFGDGAGSIDRGAIWVLFLNNDGTVKGHQKINETEGGFGGDLTDIDLFGNGIDCLGDLDGDGVSDIAVGAIADSDGGLRRGAVWLLYMKSDGTVKRHEKISDTEGGFAGGLDDGDRLGSGVALLGDLDEDGLLEIAVTAKGDDDGGMDRGAVWILGTRFEAPEPVEPGCHALRFDGVDDYVEIPHSESIKPPLPITVMAWIKPVMIGQHQWILRLDDQSSRYYGVWWHLRDDGRLACSFGDGGSQTPSSRRTKVGDTVLTAGQWYHAAVVLRGAEDISIYLNGIDDGGTYGGSGGALAYSSNGSSFISRKGGLGYSFDGMIDEVGVYSRAVSAAEIQAIMSAGPDDTEMSLAGYWNLDEGAGQVAADSSGNGNDGRLGSTAGVDDYDPTWVDCEPPEPPEPGCHALHFAAGKDRVTVSDSPSLRGMSELTISVWVNYSHFAGGGGHYTLLRKVDAYAINIGRWTGDLAVGIHNGSQWIGYSGGWLDTDLVVAADEWHHIAITWDGAELIPYVDGVKGTSFAGSGAIGNSGTPLWLGTDMQLSHLNGDLDEVVIYDRALNTAEISALMSRGPEAGDLNLVAYWSFGEGEGQFVGDSSGNDNHGVLGSAPAVDDYDPTWTGSCAPVYTGSPSVMAQRHIRVALDLKQACLRLLDEAIENELMAQDYLDEMLESGEYEGLKRNDIVRATQEIHTAIQHEEQAEAAVEKSVDNLDDALEALEVDSPGPDGNGNADGGGEGELLGRGAPQCWQVATQSQGDVDGDGLVGSKDWAALRESFGANYWTDATGTKAEEYNPCCDFNHDGSVDAGDWPMFRDNFGKGPPGQLGRMDWPPVR